MDFVRQMQSGEYGTLEIIQLRTTILGGKTVNAIYTPPKNYWVAWLEIRQGDIAYDKLTLTMVLDNVQYPTFYLGMETDYPLPLNVVKPCRESTVFSFFNTDSVVQDLSITIIGILIPFEKLEEFKNRFGIAAWKGENDFKFRELSYLAKIAGLLEEKKEVVTGTTMVE